MLLVVAACTDDKPPVTAPRTTGPSLGVSPFPENAGNSCFAADVYKAGFLQQLKDSLGNNSLASGGCTSNDVKIATADVISYSINGGPTIPFDTTTVVSCPENANLTLSLRARLEETATSQRTDIGVWIANDAGNARTGICKQFNLLNPGPNDTTGVINDDGDSCGDMKASGKARLELGTITAVCRGNTSADTLVHIGSCLGWTQPGTGGDDRTCPTTSSRTGIPNPAPGSPDAFRYGTTPGTTSKCNCQGFDVPIVINKTAQIQINKVCSDNGTFDLKIDGSTSDAVGTFGEDKTCGTNTGLRTVSAGTNKNPGATHTVAEDGFSVDPSNYISKLSCTKNGSAYIPEAAYTSPNTVNVQTNPNDVVICTFTNTRKGSITIVKNTVPDGPQDFAFTTTGGLSPATFSLDDDQDPTLSNTQTFSGLTPGQFTVTEGAQTGFDLTALTCNDGQSTVPSTTNLGSRTATINVEAGESVTCTYTNTQRGNINIVKNTVPDGPQDFSFTSTVTGHTSFILDDDNDPTRSNTEAMTNVVPGQYTVAEAAATGFGLTALTCNDGQSATPSTTSIPTRTATVNVEPGETVTCTFENTQGGTINIVKNTVPDGPQDFSFTSTITGHTSFVLDDDNDPTRSNTETAGGVPPGQYTVTEAATTGFDLTDLTCSDANSTVNKNTGVATINLEAGETVTCTYTNTQRGNINIVKNTVPDGPQDFSFTSTVTGHTSFILDDDNDPTRSNTEAMTNVVPGQYTVTEAALTGFDLTALSCNDGQSVTPSTTNLGTGTATVNVEPGETVTCTYTNTQRGTINIVKNTVPDGPQDFAFTSTGGLTPSSFSLDDDNDPTLPNTQNILNVVPGQYTVTEGAQAGFALTALSCNDGQSVTPSTTNLGSRTATINVEAGETVTCTFTNTQGGGINIVKNTVPDGPQDFAFTSTVTGNTSFSLDDDNDPTLPNTKSMSVSPGQYTVSEGAQAGFELTALSCNDSQSAVPSTTNLGTRTATVNVEPGETVTCTFTNTQQAQITVAKSCTGGSGATFGYTLTAPDQTQSSFNRACGASSVAVQPTTAFGTYAISETTIPGGWAFDNLVCTGGGGNTSTSGSTATVNLDPGENVTCTYTNKVQGRSQIAPTQVSCDDFAKGGAPVLASIGAGVDKQTSIIGNVAPGVFFYYAEVTKGANQSVGFAQVVNPNPGTLPLYEVLNGQAFLYSVSGGVCTKVATLTLTGNTTGSGGESLPAGNYILGVKFSPSAAVGDNTNGITKKGDLLATHNYSLVVGGAPAGGLAWVNTNVK